MANTKESIETNHEWPLCIVSGCQNNCCLRLNSDRCYPHTIGFTPRQNSETDYLLQGNNGERLRESIKQMDDIK